MEYLFFSPIALAIFFALYTLFKLPHISRNRWARFAGILSVLLFLASLLGLSVRLHSGIVAKYSASGNIHHGREVLKITNHLERLLEGGECKKATILLNEFNEDYPIKSRNINELIIFVDDLITSGETH